MRVCERQLGIECDILWYDDEERWWKPVREG